MSHDNGALVPTRKPYRYVTEERIEKLLAALQRGFTRTAACAIADISRAHFYDWLEGENPTHPTPDGASSEPAALTNKQRVEAAEARAQAVMEQIVLSSAGHNAQDAWLWLKRRAGEDWGATAPKPGAGQSAPPSDVDFLTLTREQLRRIAAGEDIGTVLRG